MGFPTQSGPPLAPQALTPGSSPATAQCPQLMRTWPLVPWPLTPWALVPPWWQGPAPRRASRAPLGRWGCPYLTLEAAGERKGHGRAGSDSESCYVCFFFPLFCFILGKFPSARLRPRSIQTPEGAAQACSHRDTKLGREKPSTKPAELGREALKSPTRGAAGGEAAALHVRQVALAQLQWVWMGKLRQAAGEARRSSETRAVLQPPASAEQAARGKLLGCGCSDTRQPAGTGSTPNPALPKSSLPPSRGTHGDPTGEESARLS